MSNPVGIEWAGWRTDTYTLQRAGWDLATEFDIRRRMYRLLLRHETMKLWALSDAIHLENLSHTMQQNLANVPIFRVIQIAPRFEVMRIATDPSDFRQIDATPQVSRTEIKSVEDFNIFASRVAKDAILVDGADMTVIEHLEAIKRLQEPQQEEFRKRVLDARGGARSEIVTQVLRFAA